MPRIPKLPKPSLFSKTKTYNPELLVSVHSNSISSSPSLAVVPSHEHIARLILDQKTASQALQTFRWASKLSGFTHSQSTYRALIHKLCAFRRFDIVKELLDEMPSSIGSAPDENIFLTVIRGLGRARMIRQVIKVLDLISGFEKIPSLKVYNSILDVLVKEDIDLARKFYREKMMMDGVIGDDYTYGILMKGLCLTNRIGDGFKLLQAMKRREVIPNTVIYNTLIHALCKNGKVGRARSLVNEMEAPNDVTFNILICAYCKENNLVQALVLVDKSFNMGFVPDMVAATKVVEVLCNGGRLTEALEILERLDSKGVVVDVVAYNTLIKGYCRVGKVKVGYSFLKEMERKGCLPNADTFNILISGFCECGMLDSALDIFDDMKTEGISWNFTTFDTLIRGLFSGGRIEDGFKILELMEDTKGGSQGRISPYNSVLYGLYKENHLQEAMEFLANMRKLFPRAVDRSLKLFSFCKEGRIADAERAYEQMTGEGGIPSALVYDCLIRGYCRAMCMQKVFELMNDMIGLGYFPVGSTFNAVISEFCNQGKVGSALKLMEDMGMRGCKPDTGSYNPLIDCLCREGHFQRALHLFQQMIGEGLVPDYLTWNSLMLCLGQERNWVESKNVLF